jgi:hypothetical protein
MFFLTRMLKAAPCKYLQRAMMVLCFRRLPIRLNYLKRLLDMNGRRHGWVSIMSKYFVTGVSLK